MLKSSRYYKSLSSSRLMQRSTGMDLMKFHSTFENKFNPSRELDYFSNPKSSLFENVFGNAFVSPRTEHGKIPPWKYRDFWTGGHPYGIKNATGRNSLLSNFDSLLKFEYPLQRSKLSKFHDESLSSDFSFQNSSSFNEYFFLIFSRFPNIEFVPHFNLLPGQMYDTNLPYFNPSIPWSIWSVYFDPRHQVNFFTLIFDSFFLERFSTNFDFRQSYFDYPFFVSKSDLLEFSKFDFSNDFILSNRAIFLASSAVFEVRDCFFSDLFFSIASIYSSPSSKFYSEFFSYFGAGDFHPFESFISEFLNDNVFFWKHGSFFHDTLYSPGSKFPYEYNTIYSLYPFISFSFLPETNSKFNFEFVSASFYDDFILSNITSESLDEEIFLEKNLVLGVSNAFENKLFFDYSRSLIELYDLEYRNSELIFFVSKDTAKQSLDPFDYILENDYFFQSVYRLSTAQFDVFSINFESRLLNFDLFFRSTNSIMWDAYDDVPHIFFSYKLDKTDSSKFDYWHLERAIYDRWSVFQSLKPSYFFKFKSFDDLSHVSSRWYHNDIRFGLFDPFDSLASISASSDIGTFNYTPTDYHQEFDYDVMNDYEVIDMYSFDADMVHEALADSPENEDDNDTVSYDILPSTLESSFDEVVGDSFFDQHLSINNLLSLTQHSSRRSVLDFRSVIFDDAYMSNFVGDSFSLGEKRSSIDSTYPENLEILEQQDRKKLWSIPNRDFSRFQLSQRFNPRIYKSFDSTSELFQLREKYKSKKFSRFNPRTKPYVIVQDKVVHQTFEDFSSFQSKFYPDFDVKDESDSTTAKSSQRFLHSKKRFTDFDFVKFVPAYRNFLLNQYFPYLLSNPYAFDVISDWYFQSQTEIDGGFSQSRPFDFFSNIAESALQRKFDYSHIGDLRFPFYENYIYQRPAGSDQALFNPLSDSWIVHPDYSFSKFSLSTIFDLFKDPYFYDAEKFVSYVYSSSSIPLSIYNVWSIDPSYDLYPHSLDYYQEALLGAPFDLSNVSEPFLDFDPDQTDDGQLVDDYLWNTMMFHTVGQFFEFSWSPVRDMYDGNLPFEVSTLRMHRFHNYADWYDIHDDLERLEWPTGFRIRTELDSYFDFTSRNDGRGWTYRALLSDDLPHNWSQYNNFVMQQDSITPGSFDDPFGLLFFTTFVNTWLDQDIVSWTSDFSYRYDLNERLFDYYSFSNNDSSYFFNSLVTPEISSSSYRFDNISYTTYPTNYDLNSFTFTQPSSFDFIGYNFNTFHSTIGLYYRDFFSRSFSYEPDFNSAPYSVDRWYSSLPFPDSNMFDFKTSFGVIRGTRQVPLDDTFYSTSLFHNFSLSRFDYHPHRFHHRISGLNNKFAFNFRTITHRFSSLSESVPQFAATLNPRIYYNPIRSREHFFYQGYNHDVDLYSYEIGADESFQIATRTSPLLDFDDTADADYFLYSDSYLLHDEFSENHEFNFSESFDASWISSAPTYDFYDVFDSSSSATTWFYALQSYTYSSSYLNYQLDRFNTAEWHAYDNPLQTYHIYLENSDARYRFVDPVFDAGILHGIHHYFLTQSSSNYIWEQVYFSFEFFIFDYFFSNYLFSLNSTVKSTFSAVAHDVLLDDFIVSEKTLYSFHYFQFKLVFDEFLSRRSYYYSLSFVRQNFLNHHWLNFLSFFYYYKIFFLEFFPQLILFFKNQIFTPFEDFSTYKYSALYYEKEILSFFQNTTVESATDWFDDNWTNSLLWFYAYSSFKSRSLFQTLSYSQFVSFFINEERALLGISERLQNDPRVWLLSAPFTQLSESVKLFNEFGLEPGNTYISEELKIIQECTRPALLQKYSFTPKDIERFREYVYEIFFSRIEASRDITDLLGFSFVFIASTNLHISRLFYFNVFLFFLISSSYAQFIYVFRFFQFKKTELISIFRRYYNAFQLDSRISFVVLSSPFLNKNVHFSNSSNKFPITLDFSSSLPQFKNYCSSISTLPFYRKATFLNFKYSSIFVPNRYYPSKLHYVSKPLIVFKSLPFFSSFPFFKSQFLSFSKSNVQSSKYHYSSQFHARRRAFYFNHMLVNRFSLPDYFRETKYEYSTSSPKHFFQGFVSSHEQYNQFLGRRASGSRYKPSVSGLTKFNNYETIPVMLDKYLDWFEVSSKLPGGFDQHFLTSLKHENFHSVYSTSRLLQNFLHKKTFFSAKTSATSKVKISFNSRNFSNFSSHFQSNSLPHTSYSILHQILFFRRSKKQVYSDLSLRYHYWSYYVSSINITSLPSIIYLKSYWNFFFFGSSRTFVNSTALSRRYGYYYGSNIFKAEDARHLFFTRMWIDQDLTYYPMSFNNNPRKSVPFSQKHVFDFLPSRYTPFQTSSNNLLKSYNGFESLPQNYLDPFFVPNIRRTNISRVEKFVSFRFFMRKLFHYNFSDVYKSYFSSTAPTSRHSYLKRQLLNVSSHFASSRFKFFRRKLKRYEAFMREKLSTRIKSADRVSYRIRRRMRRLRSKSSSKKYNMSSRFMNIFSHSINSVSSFQEFSSSFFGYSKFLDFIVSIFFHHFEHNDYSYYHVPRFKEWVYPFSRGTTRKPSFRVKRRRFNFHISRNMKIKTSFFRRRWSSNSLLYFSDFFTSLDNEHKSNQLTHFDGLVYEPYLSDYKSRDRIEFPRLLRSLHGFNFNRFFRRRRAYSITYFLDKADYSFRPRYMRYRRNLGSFKKRHGFIFWRYAQNKPFTRLYRVFRQTLTRKRYTDLQPTSFPPSRLRSYVFPNFYSRWLRVSGSGYKPSFQDQRSTPENGVGDYDAFQFETWKSPDLLTRLDRFKETDRYDSFISKVYKSVSLQKPVSSSSQSLRLRPSFYDFNYNRFGLLGTDELALSFFRSRSFSLSKTSQNRADLERLSAYRFHTGESFDPLSFQGVSTRYPWFSKHPFNRFIPPKAVKPVMVDDKQFDPIDVLEREKARAAKLQEELREKTRTEIFQEIIGLRSEITSKYEVNFYSDLSDEHEGIDIQTQDNFVESDDFEDFRNTSIFENLLDIAHKAQHGFGRLKPYNYQSSKFLSQKRLNHRFKLKRRGKRRRRKLLPRMRGFYMKNYSYIKMWPNIFYGFYRFSLFPFASTSQFFNFSFKNFFLSFFVNKYEFWFNFIFFIYKFFYAFFYLVFYIFYAFWFSWLSLFDSFQIYILIFFAKRAHFAHMKRLSKFLESTNFSDLDREALFGVAHKFILQYRHSINFYIRPFIYNIDSSYNSYFVKVYCFFNKFISNADIFKPLHFFRFNFLFLFDLFYRTIYSKVLFSKVQLPKNHRFKTIFIYNWLFDKVYWHFLLRSRFYVYFPLFFIILFSRFVLYFVRFFMFFVFSVTFFLISFLPNLSNFYILILFSFFLKMFFNFFIFIFRYFIIKLSLVAFFFFKFFVIHDELQTFGLVFRVYDKWLVVKYFFSKLFAFFFYINFSQFFLNFYIFWFFKFIKFFFIFTFRKFRLTILLELIPLLLSLSLVWFYYQFYQVLTFVHFFSIFFRFDFFWSIFFVQISMFTLLALSFQSFYSFFRQTISSIFSFLCFLHFYFIYFGFYELFLSKYNANSFQNFSFLDSYLGWENKLSKLLSNNVWFDPIGYISYRGPIHRDPSTYFNLRRALAPEYNFAAAQYQFKTKRSSRRLNTYLSKSPYPIPHFFGKLFYARDTGVPYTTSTLPTINIHYLVNTSNSYLNSTNFYWNFFNPSVGSVYETFYDLGTEFQDEGIAQLVGGQEFEDTTRYGTRIGANYLQQSEEYDDGENPDYYWPDDLYDAGSIDSMNFFPGFLFRQFASKTYFGSTYKGYSSLFSSSIYSDQISSFFQTIDFNFMHYDEFVDYEELEWIEEAVNHDWDFFERPSIQTSYHLFMFDITEIERFTIFKKAQVLTTFFTNKLLFFNFQLDFFRAYFISKFLSFKFIFIYLGILFICSFFLLVTLFWFSRTLIFSFLKNVRRYLTSYVLKKRKDKIESGFFFYFVFLLLFYFFFNMFSIYSSSAFAYSLMAYVYPFIQFFQFLLRYCLLYDYEFFYFLVFFNQFLTSDVIFYSLFSQNFIFFKDIWIQSSALNLFFSPDRFFKSSSLLTSQRVFSRSHYIAGYHNKFGSFSTMLYSPAINYFGYIINPQHTNRMQWWSLINYSVTFFGWVRMANSHSPLHFFHRFYSRERGSNILTLLFGFFGDDATPYQSWLRTKLYSYWTFNNIFPWPFKYFWWELDYDLTGSVRKNLKKFYQPSNYYHDLSHLKTYAYVDPYFFSPDFMSTDTNSSSYYRMLLHIFSSSQDKFYRLVGLERQNLFNSIILGLTHSSLEDIKWTDSFGNVDIAETDWIFSFYSGFDFVYRLPEFHFGGRLTTAMTKSTPPKRLPPDFLPSGRDAVDSWPITDDEHPGNQNLPVVFFHPSKVFKFFRLPVESQFRFISSYSNFSQKHFYPGFGFRFRRFRIRVTREFIKNFYILFSQYRTLFEFQLTRIEYYNFVYKNITYMNNLVVNSSEFVSRRYNRLTYLSDWGFYKDTMQLEPPTSYEPYTWPSVCRDSNISPKSSILLASEHVRGRRGPNWHSRASQQALSPFEIGQEILAPSTPEIWSSRILPSVSTEADDESDTALDWLESLYNDKDTFAFDTLSQLSDSKDYSDLPIPDYIIYPQHSKASRSKLYTTYRLSNTNYSTVNSTGYNEMYYDWYLEKRFNKYMNYHSFFFGYLDEETEDLTDFFMKHFTLPSLPIYRPFHRWNPNTPYFLDYQVVYDSLKQFEIDSFRFTRLSQVKSNNHLITLLNDAFFLRSFYIMVPNIQFLFKYFFNIFLFSRHVSVYQFEKFLNWTVYRYFFTNAQHHTVSTFLSYIPINTPPGKIPDSETSKGAISFGEMGSSFINLNRHFDPRLNNLSTGTGYYTTGPIFNYLLSNIQSGFLFQTSISFAKIYQNKFILIFSNKFHPSVFLSQSYSDFFSPSLRPSFIFSTLINSENRGFLYNLFVRYPQVVFGFRKPKTVGAYNYFNSFSPMSSVRKNPKPQDHIFSWQVETHPNFTSNLFYFRRFVNVPYRVFDFSTYPGRRFHFAYYNTFFSSPLYFFIEPQRFLTKLGFFECDFLEDTKSTFLNKQLIFLTSERQFSVTKKSKKSFTRHPHEEVYSRKYYYSNFVPFKLLDLTSFIPYRVYQTLIRQEYFYKYSFIIRSSLDYSFWNSIKVSPRFFFQQDAFKSFFDTQPVSGFRTHHFYFRGTRWPVEAFRFAGISYLSILDTTNAESYDSFTIKGVYQSEDSLLRVRNHNYYKHGNRGGIFSYPTESIRRTKRDRKFFKYIDKNNIF